MPIIDPNTLTEGQKELLLKDYVFHRKTMESCIGIKSLNANKITQCQAAKVEELEYIFGKDFFAYEKKK